MTPESLYWRQLGIISPRELEQAEVTLIGAGGIGSPTALALAKMGIPKLTVYDPDTIEEHNLPNQMYPVAIPELQGFKDSNIGYQYVSTIGMSKVYVLRDVVEHYGELRLRIEHGKYESQPLSGIVISGVDSMQARQVIWEGVKNHSEFVDLYLDARMGAEVGVVYAVNPKDAEQSKHYETNFLFDDAEALELPCTARSIIYNTLMIASLIARQVKAQLKGQYVPFEIVFDMANLVLMVTQEQVDE